MNDAEPTLLFYGNPLSGHSYKIAMMLHMGNIPHHYQFVDLQKPRLERRIDFQKLTPYGQAPVIVDKGHIVYEANAILLYLAKSYGVFYPSTVRAQQALDFFLIWEANRLGYNVAYYTHIMKFDQNPDPKICTLYKNKISRDLLILEEKLSQSDFLLGQTLSIADLACSAYLFSHQGIALDLTSYPNILRWLDNISKIKKWDIAEKLLPIKDTFFA